MSKNTNGFWNTKYGPRRVRRELPTVKEAIAAAQGLTDELEQQVEIAASLIGMPPDEVRVELLKFSPPRKDIVKSVTFAGSPSAPRAVVVERKPARRLAANIDRNAAMARLRASVRG